MEPRPQSDPVRLQGAVRSAASPPPWITGVDRSSSRMRRFARPWVVVVILLFFALGMCSDGDDRPSASPPDPSTTAPQQPSEASTTSTTPAELPSVAPTTQPRPAPDAPSGAFAVRSVTDGDTLTVDDGRRVRLAQVDAPETNECFGAESTGALRAMVDGQRVELRRPSNGPERDRYGRTLAEVSVAGVSVNEQLVRDGAAEWYKEFASEDADLAARLRAAERDAQSAGKGLWSGCTIPAPSAPTPREDVNAATPSGLACHPGYPDACIPPSPPDLDCADVGRRVRVDHAAGDPHQLDADGDGWGCQTYG